MLKVTRVSSRRYAISDGSRLLPERFTNRDAARRWLERTMREMERQTVERPCLTCGRPFDSEGPHNRMCNECRRRASSPVWGAW